MVQEITVSSLMTRDISQISPSDMLTKAIDVMARKTLSCILVTEENTPIGIITERDLVKVLQNSKSHQELQELTVADIMTSPITTIEESDSFYEAIVVSRAYKVRHLPVIDDNNRLSGLITHTDLTNAYMHLIELQTEQLEKARDLTEKNEELLLLSMEDHLMCIGNRRAMEADLHHTHEQAIRNKENYAVILFDIDYFKNYNDHYGHSAGDDALRKVAKHLKSKTRGSDHLYRYGGEEVLLLLPGADNEQTLGSAQRQLEHFSALSLPHEKSPFNKITLSAGVGFITPQKLKGKSWQDVVALADKHLYEAKQAGRNQAIAAPAVELT